MKKLLSQIVAAIAGLWLAAKFIPGIEVPIEQWQLFLTLGAILGLLNFFVKPVINAITLPLRIITLGLFGIAVNMAMLWFLDSMFDELSMPLFLPLFYTTLIIWGINFIIQKILIKDKE